MKRRDAYEREYARTSQIIESRFDEDVRKVFRRLRDELPDALAQLDRDLATLVDAYLQTRGIAYERTEDLGRVIFDLSGSVAPLEVGSSKRFATGDIRGLKDAEPLNLAHPLVQVAVNDARSWEGGSLLFQLPSDAPGLGVASA